MLKAVISLRLMPRADGLGRVPAAEVMITTPYIRDCIENKEKTMINREHIAAGTTQYGMQTFDQSLFSSARRAAVDHRGRSAQALLPR